MWFYFPKLCTDPELVRYCAFAEQVYERSFTQNERRLSYKVVAKIVQSKRNFKMTRHFSVTLPSVQYHEDPCCCLRVVQCKQMASRTTIAVIIDAPQGCSLALKVWSFASTPLYVHVIPDIELSSAQYAVRAYRTKHWDSTCCSGHVAMFPRL